MVESCSDSSRQNSIMTRMRYDQAPIRPGSDTTRTHYDWNPIPLAGIQYNWPESNIGPAETPLASRSSRRAHCLRIARERRGSRKDLGCLADISSPLCRWRRISTCDVITFLSMIFTAFPTVSYSFPSSFLAGGSAPTIMTIPSIRFSPSSALLEGSGGGSQECTGLARGHGLRP